MNDLDLAEEIERHISYRPSGFVIPPYQLYEADAKQIIAALRRGPERDPMDYFRKGRESVLRKNQSGCCCLFNEEDEIVSVCMAHKEWAERPPSSEMVMVSRFALDSAADALERNDKFAGGVAEDIRRWLSAAEAEGRKS